MRKTISILLISLILTLGVTAGYAKDGINEATIRAEKLYELELFLGTSTETFNPNLEGATDRAAAMVMVARVLNWVNGEDWNEEAISGFDDVPSWAEPHVAYAVDNDITLGIGNNLFGNELPVTDRQLQTWFDRALGKGNTWTENGSLDNTTPLIRSDLVNKSWKSLQEIPVKENKTLIKIIIGEDEEKLVIAKENNLIIEKGQKTEETEVKEDKEIVYNNVKIFIATDKVILSEGGNQTVELTVKVLTDDGQPASKTPVDFFATSEKNNVAIERKDQFSETRIITDESGIVKVQYTTILADDNTMVELCASVPEGNGRTDKRKKVVVSNSAASVKGRVINPFTGKSISGVKLSFTDPSTNNHFFFEDATDVNGDYYVGIIPGNYYPQIDIDFKNEYHYTGHYIGSNHEFKGDNTTVLRLRKIQIDEKKAYTLNTEMGVIKGVVSNHGANSEIHIHHNGIPNKTFIANIKEDGSFMIPLPEDSYQIDYRGQPIKYNINVKKGETMDLGTLYR